MGGRTGHDGGRETARPRRRMVGSLAVGLAAAALLATGCSGGSSNDKKGVANIGNATKSASAQPTKISREQAKAAALNYSKCMRTHGIPQFPDPDANGGIAIDGDKVKQDSPQFKSADQACKSLLPAPPAGVPENRTAGLKYASCMRSHGVSKFPDPAPGGGLNIDADKLGVDPNGSVFKAADKACQHFLSTGNEGPANSGGK
jgi:hypothetical protein